MNGCKHPKESQHFHKISRRHVCLDCGDNLDLPFGGRDAEGAIMGNEGGRHVLGA